MTDAHAARVYAVCLRFFVELEALGVTDVVISPGSRSTPLAVSARHAGLRCTVHLDERVAGFHALGQAKATGRPSVLVCSSGTAGAHYLPAVIEAHHAHVPMIVCTADRPPELRTWGAGQTVEQLTFYGDALRWRTELPVGGEVDEWMGRSVALRAVALTTGPVPGPAHLNWPFREPLEPPRELARPVATTDAEDLAHHVDTLSDGALDALASRYERGLVVVGPGDRTQGEVMAVLDFAAHAGWPVVADPGSQVRNHTPPEHPALVVTTGELLFGSPDFADALDPQIVLRVGLAPTSKAYRLWVERCRPERLVLVGPGIEWADPTHSFDQVVPGPVAAAFAYSTSHPGRGRTEWVRAWAGAEELAAAIVAAQVAEDDGELAVAAALVDNLPGAATLVTASSMPIRDLEVVMRADDRALRVVTNRGANGIDGIVSTALGVASTTSPVVVFTGDVALVHDLGGLIAGARLQTDLTVVVVDNDGGGIFSFLPIAGFADAVGFEELFRTPHGTPLASLAAVSGYEVADTDAAGFPAALLAALAHAGPSLVRVQTDAASHVGRFAGLREAIRAAMTPDETPS